MHKITHFLTMMTLLIMGNYLFAGQVDLGQENKTQVTENTWKQLKVTQTFGKFDFANVKTTDGQFALLTANGSSFTTIVGDPRLPVFRSFIEIPFGADVEIEAKVLTSTEYTLAELGITEEIIPVQLPVTKDNSPLPPFKKNNQVYKTNSFYPNELYSVDILGVMRGSRLGRLNICPIQYNPVTKKVKVYSQISITIKFNNADIALTIANKKLNNTPGFQVIDQMVLNSKPVNSTKDTLTKYPVKYVIVSPRQFESVLQPFIAWKTKKGFNVVEAYTDMPSVGNTTASIKGYLQGLYNNGTASDPAPSYVLLIGDIAQLPAFNGTTGSHVSDLPFVEYTNDFLPELYIGRMSATNESQLIPQLEKTLEYEQYLFPDPSFLNEVVMIAGVDATWAPIHGNGQINYGTDMYFNAAHGLTSHTYLYPQSGSSASQIRQNVSNGVGFANYTAHGSSGGWADPSFSVSDVNNLQNAHKYPLMIGNCCLTNKFDDPTCFGEALLRANNKGALGYIGGTNSSYWDEDFYWGVGVRTIVLNPTWTAGNSIMGSYDRYFHDHGEPFSQWMFTQGQILFAGNLAVTLGSPGSMDYYWEMYALMGDPSLSVYFSVPPPVTANYPALMPLAVTSFTVNTDPYAYVAISKNGVLHGAALADGMGVAVVNIAPITVPGYANVVITAQNKEPHIDSVLVASPTGPYVVMTSHQIADPTGNANNLADFGETVDLSLTLNNFGQANANSLNLIITSTDPDVVINDGTATCSTVPSNGNILLTNAFNVTFSNDIADQHKVNFDLTITDNLANSWSGTLKIPVNAPHFNIGLMTINDAIGGNGNNRLDPGETVDVIINLINDGHSNAPGTQSTIASASSIATLNTASYALNTVNNSASVQAIFNLTISPSAQSGDILPLDFNVGSGFYTAAKSFSATVGLISEDWESGTLTHFAWQNSSNGPWFLTTDNPYEGLYCLRSGNINNSASTSISLNVNVLAEDSISFYRKVSSEDGYDMLQFFVNNNMQEEWSGEQAWARAAYKVSPGNTVFKWTYDKDWSQISGSDCGWIDFVVFPPIAGIGTGIADNDNSLFNFGVYPNPTRTQSQIVFYIEKSQPVQLRIFDATGREVSVVLKGNQLGSGQHSYYFDASQLGKGIYFCEFLTAETKLVKKLVVE